MTATSRPLPRLAAVLAAAVLAFGLGGCTSPAPSPSESAAPSSSPTESAATSAPTESAATPSATSSEVIAPVVEDVNDLDGTTVQLVVGQTLDINTGDLAVDSYTGTVADEAVAEFVPGRDDGSATFNPGVLALEEGSTQVTLANDQGGIEEVRFTVDVTAP